jgi:hypothetical protein
MQNLKMEISIVFQRFFKNKKRIPLNRYIIQMSQRNQLQQNTIQRFPLVFKILRDGSRNFGSGVGQKNRKSISGAMRPTSQDWILKFWWVCSVVLLLNIRYS